MIHVHQYGWSHSNISYHPFGDDDKIAFDKYQYDLVYSCIKNWQVHARHRIGHRHDLFCEKSRASRLSIINKSKNMVLLKFLFNNAIM